MFGRVPWWNEPGRATWGPRWAGHARSPEKMSDDASGPRIDLNRNFLFDSQAAAIIRHLNLAPELRHCTPKRLLWCGDFPAFRLLHLSGAYSPGIRLRLYCPLSKQ